MKKLLLLIVAIIALVACNKDQDMDLVLGVENTITLNLDEATRGDAGLELQTLDAGYRYRYILEVYHNGKYSRQVQYDTSTSTAFKVNLPPNRAYTFVAWVDIVAAEATESPYYTTENGLNQISIKTANWVANDDHRDAFTGFTSVQSFSSSSTIDLNLKRPFAKVQIVATNTNDKVTKAAVSYSTQVATSFNAASGKFNSLTNRSFAQYALVGCDAAGDKVIFSDYIFADEQPSPLSLTLTLYDADNNKLKELSTTVNIKRNTLTTIKGGIL
ncbi:MAG: DUF6562 domain-containing protein [Alistipes sp.]|nr:DUF6562 domain-containing protein [Alistipes sp.]